MNIPMKIDITTGDEITPRQIDYRYKCMFEEKSVLVKAYTLETILAEKYETVMRRNIGNTRARDFYDLFVLMKIKKNEIRWDILKEAVLATSKKRGSWEELKEYRKIIEEMRESDFLRRVWKKYKDVYKRQTIKNAPKSFADRSSRRKAYFFPKALYSWASAS